MHDGEEVEEMDTGIPLHDPARKHVDLENLCEEDIYPDRDGSEGIADQEEREEKRQEPKAMLKAAKNLLRIVYGATDESVSMEEFESSNPIIAIYLRERMDGVIAYYFDNRYDSKIAEDVLEFCRKMFQFQPRMSKRVMTDIITQARKEVGSNEVDSNGGGNLPYSLDKLPISSRAKAKLISKAQWEQSRHNNHNSDKPASRLGKAIFGNRWERILRAK